MLPYKTIKYSLIVGALLAPVVIAPNAFADYVLPSGTYDSRTGTSGSPYTITDGNLIQIDGYLRVLDSNGTDGGYVNLNSGNLLIIGPNGGVDVSGNTAGARGGVANITGGSGGARNGRRGTFNMNR
ncbi:MAG: hypothetical protein KC475_06070 [Cyanobacteria bacterium HKST-UBA03]|nr:hypothetical protein [Cyanobacteria bacterium HKST-UBA03]